jgi:4-alpha-glucanotransferase
MSGALRSADPASDRINVPGTNSATNWTWRMSAPIESLSRDPELAEGCRAIVGARDGGVTRTRDGRRG